MAYEKKKKTRHPIKLVVILAVIVPLGFFLIASTVGRSQFNLPHKLTLEILGPFQGVVTSSLQFCKDSWHHYLDLVGVSKENDALRLEIQELRAKNLAYREAAATNVSLNKMLELKNSFESLTVTAQIIGRDPALWFKTVTINKGSSDGVQKGMPVVTVAGVVGQVSNTSPHYAKILLSIDPNSAIDAIVQESRAQGIIKGNGKAFILQYVLKNNALAVGNQVITSGMGGVFPKGLAIGTISSVVNNKRGMFQNIQVEPAVDFRQLEYVAIILKKDPLTD